MLNFTQEHLDNLPIFLIGLVAVIVVFFIIPPIIDNYEERKDA